MTRSGGPLLALFGIVFVATYYATRLATGASWQGAALYAVPPGLAAFLLLRRGDRARGRAMAFWNLLGLGAALWLSGQCLWALAVYQGEGPWLSPEIRVPLRGLFIGFLVPMIGALGLAPHPYWTRKSFPFMSQVLLQKCLAKSCQPGYVGEPLKRKSSLLASVNICRSIIFFRIYH